MKSVSLATLSWTYSGGKGRERKKNTKRKSGKVQQKKNLNLNRINGVSEQVHSCGYSASIIDFWCRHLSKHLFVSNKWIAFQTSSHHTLSACIRICISFSFSIWITSVVKRRAAHRQYRNFLMTTNATNAVKLFTLQFNGHCTICTPPTQMDKKWVVIENETKKTSK